MFATNNKINEKILYNKIIFLSRNKSLYKEFNLKDSFQNRIILIFLHVSFLFIKVKQDSRKIIYKKFYQEMFNYIFKQIEINMRELGFGDTIVNKNMKFLVTTFYNILLNCEKYKEKADDSKNLFFSTYLDPINKKKDAINPLIIDYFNKYEAFCFEISPDSVLKGDFNFKYE